MTIERQYKRLLMGWRKWRRVGFPWTAMFRLEDAKQRRLPPLPITVDWGSNVS